MVELLNDGASAARTVHGTNCTLWHVQPGPQQAPTESIVLDHQAKRAIGRL